MGAPRVEPDRYELVAGRRVALYKVQNGDGTWRLEPQRSRGGKKGEERRKEAAERRNKRTTKSRSRSRPRSRSQSVRRGGPVIRSAGSPESNEPGGTGGSGSSSGGGAACPRLSGLLVYAGRGALAW